MREAVENQSPHVVIVDEISSRSEVPPVPPVTQSRPTPSSCPSHRPRRCLPLLCSARVCRPARVGPRSRPAWRAKARRRRGVGPRRAGCRSLTSTEQPQRRRAGGWSAGGGAGRRWRRCGPWRSAAYASSPRYAVAPACLPACLPARARACARGNEGWCRLAALDAGRH
jgi:hypothetical protein